MTAKFEKGFEAQTKLLATIGGRLSRFPTRRSIQVLNSVQSALTLVDKSNEQIQSSDFNIVSEKKHGKSKINYTEVTTANTIATLSQ